MEAILEGARHQTEHPLDVFVQQNKHTLKFIDFISTINNPFQVRIVSVYSYINF